MSVHELVGEAFKLMGLGVGMVFAVLAVFYGLVRALMILFPVKEENKNES